MNVSEEKLIYLVIVYAFNFNCRLGVDWWQTFCLEIIMSLLFVVVTHSEHNQCHMRLSLWSFKPTSQPRQIGGGSICPLAVIRLIIQSVEMQ